MILLKDGTEITESFGANGISDIKKVINHYDNKLDYLQDDYILDTYLKDCIISTDLQFVNDLNILFTYLNTIDKEAKTIQERYNNQETQKPRELESDINKLQKAKEVMEKYSDSNNEKVTECIKILNQSISELNSIKVELKSYIIKHTDVRPLTRNSHLKYYGNNLLPKRINYFKPKPQIINELINNYTINIKNNIDNINATQLEYLLNYLKEDYYKIS